MPAPAIEPIKWANPPERVFLNFNGGQHTFSEAEARYWRERGGDVRAYAMVPEPCPTCEGF